MHLQPKYLSHFLLSCPDERTLQAIRRYYLRKVVAYAHFQWLDVVEQSTDCQNATAQIMYIVVGTLTIYGYPLAPDRRPIFFDLTSMPDSHISFLVIHSS